jgi:hypothetical protein
MSVLERVKTWTLPDTRGRRLLIALAIYVLTTGVYAAVAGPARLSQHTIANHYALLADAWVHGRQDLPGGFPAYTQGNDFAQVTENGTTKTYISFPPFPSVLMVPFVALAGEPENFRDGQFIIWLAGLGPAFMFLVLEKLRRTKRSPRTEKQNAALALLFAFGTVYFFTAVQGTVWFAAHVVGVALAALVVLLALDAELPLLAGALVACGWMTRPTLLLYAIFFGLEAIRVCQKSGLPSAGTLAERARALWNGLDKRAFATKVALFSAPILVAFGIMSWMNFTRYHLLSPFAFGHEFLTVAWKARMQKWGLFGLHYLPKNLGVSLTILPFLPPKGTVCMEYVQPNVIAALRTAGHCTPFQVNEHGLALWFTVPIYLWLFRPAQKGWLFWSVVATTAVCALMNLLYQNSGWRQFGYRFSNDYAPLLFVLLAVGARPMKRLFAAAAAWGLAWNLFGALTFDHAELDRFYWRDGSQALLYQPD